MTSLLKANATVRRLKSLRAKLAHLERQRSRMKTLERKQDTRRKIELGGLLKKARLDTEPTAVLYGLLLEAKELLDSKNADNVRREWKLKGDLALTAESIIKSKDP